MCLNLNSLQLRLLRPCWIMVKAPNEVFLVRFYYFHRKREVWAMELLFLDFPFLYPIFEIKRIGITVFRSGKPNPTFFSSASKWRMNLCGRGVRSFPLFQEYSFAFSSHLNSTPNSMWVSLVSSNSWSTGPNFIMWTCDSWWKKFRFVSWSHGTGSSPSPLLGWCSGKLTIFTLKHNGAGIIKYKL